MERDKQNQEILSEMGWRVIIVWECQLKKDKAEAALDELFIKITE